MFSEPLSTLTGRSVPRTWLMSTLLMLPLSLKYRYPAPVPPSTTMPAATQAVISRPLRRLLRALRRRPFARWRGALVPDSPDMPGSGLLSAGMCSSVLVRVGYPLLSGSGPFVVTHAPPWSLRTVRRGNSGKGCTTLCAQVVDIQAQRVTGESMETPAHLRFQPN